jgi:hypothetical protein
MFGILSATVVDPFQSEVGGAAPERASNSRPRLETAMSLANRSTSPA